MQRDTTDEERKKREEERVQPKPISSQISTLVQRQEEDEEEKKKEEELIQNKPLSAQVTPLIRRQVKDVEKKKREEEMFQAKEDSGGVKAFGGVESSINSLRGGGKPLSESTRDYFEPRFGYDFSGVRVHTESEAAKTAKSINARAFTFGNNVVFGSSSYSPETVEGRKLLAHELTHVIQQKAVAESGQIPVTQSIDSCIQCNGSLWEEPPDPEQERLRRCRNWLNWTDGGHWMGSGPEPDCSNAGVPGIELRQRLERIGDAFWAKVERNRRRLIDIRDNASSDAEALAQAFESDEFEDDGTVEGRLRTILFLTKHPVISGLQTGIEFGDTGFREEYRDSNLWPSSSNQVGHFLTAVRLGFDPSFLDSPLNRYILSAGDEDVDTMALRLIVGHEKVADPGIFGAFMSLIPFPGQWGFEEQYHSATDEDIENFRSGLLSNIAVGSGQGNSMQDLRLSYKGWKLGGMIVRGEMTSREDVAAWIRRELMEEVGDFPLITPAGPGTTWG